MVLKIHYSLFLGFLCLFLTSFYTSHVVKGIVISQSGKHVIIHTYTPIRMFNKKKVDINKVYMSGAFGMNSNRPKKLWITGYSVPFRLREKAKIVDEKLYNELAKVRKN